MSSLLVPALWLTVLGFPASWLVLRSVPVAALVTPLVAALVCALAAMAAVVTHTPLIVWVIGLTVAGLGGALRWRPRVRVHLPAWQVAVVALFASPVLVMARVSPYEWDARSIWWFHAEWFQAGGARAGDAIGSPLLAWSHPDYPPLISATVATMWRLTGGHADAKMALSVSLVVTWSALASLGVAIVWALRRVTSARPWGAPVAVAVAGLAALAASGFAPLAAGTGYVDHLWSAWFAAAAVLLVLAPLDRDTTFVGVLFLAAAMLTKNEAMAGGLGLVVLATIRHRRRGRLDLALLWVPVVLAVSWAAIAHGLGARSDLMQGGRFRELLHGDDPVLDQLPYTVSWLRDLVQGMAVATAVVSATGALVCWGRRRRSGLGSDLWLWAWLAGDLTVLVVTYLISPYEPGWLLVTSAGRTTLAPMMVLIAMMAVGAVLAVVPEATEPDVAPVEADTAQSRPARS